MDARTPDGQGRGHHRGRPGIPTDLEAWEISQEIQARGEDKKLNMVVDGISNTSPDEMISRAKSFTEKGYKAKAVYVDIPTDEAMKRALNRATNAQKDSDKRMIPEIIMRSVHRDVAATVPNMIRRLREENIDLEVEVWDNADGNEPRCFFTFKDGMGEVLDVARWSRFVLKTDEAILGVDAE